jgi:Fe-S-cluster containining protein
MSETKASPRIAVAGSAVRPLVASDLVELTCGTAGCPSTCCKNGPPIVLNPYEIELICRASGRSYEDLLDVVETDRADGFPLVMLPREPACHFWTEKGCRIYRARPLACRLFPLGRVFDRGRSYIVLPDRNRCSGLVASPTRTLKEYLREQDTETLVRMADVWITFVEDMERADLPDAPVTSVAFHLLVYSPDTPPTDDGSRVPSGPEERYLLRLATSRQKLPEFLRSR